MELDPSSLDMLAQVADEREHDLRTNGGDRLERIARAGQLMIKIEHEIAQLEEAIEQRKRELQDVRTKVIPDLLRSVGMNSFSLDDGSIVELKDELYPDIPSARREEAYTWLRDNGHGDLIKHEIKLTFGMGEDQEALAVRKMLASHNSPLNFSEKETILSQSLRAWVREQERRGTDLPNELFPVHRVTTAQIKAQKKR